MRGGRRSNVGSGKSNVEAVHVEQRIYIVVVVNQRVERVDAAGETRYGALLNWLSVLIASGHADLNRRESVWVPTEQDVLYCARVIRQPLRNWPIHCERAVGSHGQEKPDDEKGVGSGFIIGASGCGKTVPSFPLMARHGDMGRNNKLTPILTDCDRINADQPLAPIQAEGLPTIT